jgi:hypothetical protein
LLFNQQQCFIYSTASFLNFIYLFIYLFSRVTVNTHIFFLALPFQSRLLDFWVTKNYRILNCYHFQYMKCDQCGILYKDSPYVPKSQLFWGWFGSRYVETAYDTNDMMLIFWKKSSVELTFSSFGDHLINILRKVNRLIYALHIFFLALPFQSTLLDFWVTKNYRILNCYHFQYMKCDQCGILY